MPHGLVDTGFGEYLLWSNASAVVDPVKYQVSYVSVLGPVFFTGSFVAFTPKIIPKNKMNAVTPAMIMDFVVLMT